MSNTFGNGFDEIWPKPETALQLSDFGRKLLEKCTTVEKPAATVDLKEFMRTSSNFPLEFGTNHCRVLSQPKARHEIITQQIASAYPVIHERALKLYLDFIEHKCKYGNKIELDIYKNLSLIDLVQRLLTKRCAAFFGRNDKFLLVSRDRGCSGFNTIGTTEQKAPLLMENVLAYDEVKLSAFLSCSSHTEFINNGTRTNCGVIERDKTKIEQDGVIVGIIGARLNRNYVMEYQDIIISKKQNNLENGYGAAAAVYDADADVSEETDTRIGDYRRIWRKFYEERDYLFTDTKSDRLRFSKTKLDDDLLDNIKMKKRFTISFDTLLYECEARAAAAGKQAYLHVVGIGLGVWRVGALQEQIFLATFEQRLKHLMPRLTHIDCVHFSWFTLDSYGELKNNAVLKSETHPSGGIRIFFSKRNPADKLVGIYSALNIENYILFYLKLKQRLPEREPNELLLVVSYPWDGNALPGNEFWMKMLKSTGDSATACSTLITELHNPHINKDFVCGNNLHIVSENYGLLHIAEYAKKILNSD